MKKMLLVIMLGLLLFGSWVYMQTQAVIFRDNTHLREGPGCYYPLIGILNKDARVAVVSQKPGWIQVDCNGTKGWISDNALKTQTKQNEALPDFGSLSGASMMISRASASGAVKGFAQKYIQYKQGDVNFLQKYDMQLLHASQYNQFKKETYQNRDLGDIRNRYRLPGDPEKINIPFYLEKIGLAIASQIAMQGLVEAPQNTAYLNQVGTLVLENSELYYYPMKFYILRDNRPAAYTTPNGIIFITQGLMDLIESEAELACLLGHEIAHVVCQHGFQEISKRKDMIAAEDAFSQLAAEIPDEKEPGEAELEEMAYSMYEAATAPRQIKYEYEADRLGAIYAYRAGYDPSALLKLLARIKRTAKLDFENFESNWEPFYIKDRIGKASPFIHRKLDHHTDWNVQLRRRYQRHF